MIFRFNDNFHLWHTKDAIKKYGQLRKTVLFAGTKPNPIIKKYPFLRGICRNGGKFFLRPGRVYAASIKGE